MTDDQVDELVEDIIDSFKLALESFAVDSSVIEESSLIVKDYYFNHYVL